MASSFSTNFGIEEIVTGEQSGTWGATTNYNWNIIDRIASYSSVTLSSTTETLTVREASPGEGTSNVQNGMFRVIKFADGGDIGGNVTVTVAPNTTAAWFVFENALSGSRSIDISQGSGANVTIANGLNAMVYCDGAGSGAAATNALADLIVSTLNAASTNISMDSKVIHNVTSSTRMASGTTGQRDGSPAVGDFRYNSTTNEFEGYAGASPAWGTLGAGGGYFKGDNGTTGSSAGDIFRINELALDADVTISSTENASATGPLTVSSSYTLTVEGTLVII